MVTAGVYLLCRMNQVLDLSATGRATIAAIGAATAFVAATIATSQHDIKKVLAFSTVSQIGFMVSPSARAPTPRSSSWSPTPSPRIFFLGAGSVIHGLDGEQELSAIGRAAPGWCGPTRRSSSAGLRWRHAAVVGVLREGRRAEGCLDVLEAAVGDRGGRGPPHRVLHDPAVRARLHGRPALPCRGGRPSRAARAARVALGDARAARRPRGVRRARGAPRQPQLRPLPRAGLRGRALDRRLLFGLDRPRRRRRRDRGARHRASPGRCGAGASSVPSSRPASSRVSGTGTTSTTPSSAGRGPRSRGRPPRSSTPSSSTARWWAPPSPCGGALASCVRLENGQVRSYALTIAVGVALLVAYLLARTF